MPKKPAQCRTGKVRYRDRIAGALALIRTRDVGAVRIYRCEHCRGWHTTSQTRKERA